MNSPPIANERNLMDRYESGLTVRISGLPFEERAHALNEVIVNLLTRSR